MKRLLCVLLCMVSVLGASSSISAESAQSAVSVAIPVGTDSYKIEVSESGIYELSYADLSAAGMDVTTVDPNTFEMMQMGNPVATQFVGNDNNLFEAGESIRFYGWAFDGIDQTDWMHPLPIENSVEHDKLYVTNNVYWLWAGGSAAQISARANATGNTPVTTWRDTVVYEEDLNFSRTFTNKWDEFEFDATPWYRASISSDTTNQTWLEDPILQQTFREYSVEVLDPVPTGADAVLISHILSTCPSYEVETHVVDISFNGDTTSTEWSNVFGKEVVQSVPASALLNGPDNLLRITSTTPAENIKEFGGTCTQDNLNTDMILYDKSVLQYDRDLKAINDELVFTYEEAGTHDFVVSNFSSNDAVVWDVTDPHVPVAITLEATDMTGNSGSFSWTIGGENLANAQYVATTPASLREPDSISQYNAVDITKEGVEWIAISHGDLMPQAKRLAEYRINPNAGDRLTTMTVDIEDVINQYGYGYPLPQAIQTYLLDGYTQWANDTLAYVMLVGDGSVNPRQLECVSCTSWGTPADNLIPVDIQFYDRFNGLMLTDHMYANLVDDGTDAGAIPEIALGRLAVDTVEQATNAVDKIVLYEQRIVDDADYMRNILFFTDRTGIGGDFCGASELIAQDAAYVDRATNFTGSVSEYCRDDYDDDASMRDLIFADMDANSDNGAVSIVNYRGDSGRNYFSGGRITANQVLDSLTNTGQPVVWLAGSSLNGDFSHPNAGQESIGEVLVQLGDIRGAAGYWGPSGVGFTRDATALYQGFYEGLYSASDTVSRIGDAIVYSKDRYMTNDFGDVTELWSYTYQGDPAMVMPFTDEADIIVETIPTAVTMTQTGIVSSQPILMLMFVGVTLISVTVRVRND